MSSGENRYWTVLARRAYNSRMETALGITAQDRETYARDGVVCLRNVFEPRWIAALREAIEEALPPRDPHAPAGRFVAAKRHLWMGENAFADFVLRSQAAEIAGILMDSTTVRIFKDQLFVKEPGAEAPTPWHHDLPFWCVDGDRICSIWLPLDDVDAESGAVEFVRGSHRWGKLFRADRAAAGSALLEPIPDIAALRPTLDIVQYDVAPGDCIAFHVRTIHGAPGNASQARRRRAYSTRWAGDDAVYFTRPDSSTTALPTTLRSGEPLAGEEFPLVWSRR